MIEEHSLSEKLEIYLQKLERNNSDDESLTSIRELIRENEERQKVKETLVEEKYHTLLELAPNAFFHGNSDGDIITVNSSAINLTGYSRAELTRMNLSGLFSPEVMHKSPLDYKSLDGMQVVRTNRTILNKSGESIPVEMNSRKMPDGTYQSFVRDLTQQVEDENKIVRLSKVVEQSPASIILTDLKGNIEYVNTKFIELTGYECDDVIGLNPRILSSGETSKKEYAKLWSAISSGREWKGEFHNKKKNGDLYWESALISPIRDEDGKIKNYLAIKEDITQRKKTEKEILRLSVGMEQSPASVVITNTIGEIEYVNKKFVETSGYPSYFLKGKMLRILKAEHSPTEVFDSIWGNLNKGVEWRGEHLNRRRNGEIYWESVLISPVKDEYNKVINLIVISEDISERKKMETDLIAAKERAEESDRLKSAFINNMSHEIRTPLNAIVGFSDLLSTQEIDVDQSAYFCEIIHNSSDQLVQVIADIINISTIDAGQVSANLSLVNVNNILITLFEQFYVVNKNQDVKISYVSTLNDEDATIMTDVTKLTQVITNLIYNALKFTEKGIVEYGVKKENDHLYFWVEDSGIGIPLGLHEKIFERFRQGDSSIIKKYGGTGLGLSIARSFVELLGGEIGVKSEVGNGSRFYFTHPYRKN